MDFFERQDNARRKTKWLVLYFLFAVALTIAAIYFLFVFVIGLNFGGRELDRGLWIPNVFFGVAGGTLLVIASGSLFKIAQLSGGGGAVAQSLGGQLLNPQSTDVDEVKLRNVVEEMAIASGTPVPEIYILRDEQGINAFAAGYSPSDAAIGVTSGAIKTLSRDELQGVIAHEFSHILNGDMRLNLRLIGLVHGILCLAIIGRVLLRTTGRMRSGSKKGGNPLPIIGIGLLAIGFIGVFFGRLIKSAISRQREFLADAAAVQFTRNPDGLAGALKKIGGMAYGSRIETPAAEEASHLFFGNGLSKSMFSWMSTHPPLMERIRLLDPAFDGKFPHIVTTPTEPSSSRREEAHSIPWKDQNRRTPFPTIPGLPFPPTSSGPRIPRLPIPPILAAQMLSSVGTLTPKNLDYAVDLRESLPENISSAIHEPLGAEAIVYSVLFSSTKETQAAQLRELESLAERNIYEETLALIPHVAELKTEFKLPLIDLAIPALRQLSPQQFEQFERNVRRLAGADQQIDLFEFALQKILLRHLKPHFHGPQKTVAQYYVLKPLAAECAVLLSALARVGHENEAEAQHAFALGVQCLRMPDQPFQLLPLNECSIDKIDAALNRLTQAALPCKKILLEACAHTILADGKAQIAESELLRAIADSLDCPIPPLVV